MTVTINGTTGLAGTNGSAGTPAVQGEDTNTGIFFPAADTVAVATGGTERLRVDSSGILSFPASTGRKVSYYTGTEGYSIGVESSNFKFVTDAGAVFTFSTGATYSSATERARIDSNGNLLVGTTSNTENAKMFVRFSGDGVNGMFLNNFASTGNPTFVALNDTAQALNNTSVSARYTDTGATRWELRKNGGLANYSANNVNLSDERVKTDVTPLGSYWDKIKALQVVTYKYLDQSHDDLNIGVIAQQVESVAPELVSNEGFGETPADGVPLKSIYEADLHYATLKALQEAMARIEILEARIAALEAK